MKLFGIHLPLYEDPRRAKEFLARALGGVAALVLVLVLSFTSSSLRQLKKENLLRYKAWADDLSTHIDSAVLQAAAGGSTLRFPDGLDELVRRLLAARTLPPRAEVAVQKNHVPAYLYRRTADGDISREAVSEWPSGLFPLHSARRLPPPFESIELMVVADHIPYSAGVFIVFTAALLLGIGLPLGLYGIYWIGAQHIDLGKQRSDFAASVSHELRTPLSAILLRAEALSEGWVSESKRAEHYSAILADGQRLNHLIESILRLTGPADSEDDLIAADIGKLLDDCLAVYKDRLAASGFRVTKENFNECGTVTLDPHLFRVAFGNVIENILKFSRDSQQKEVAISQSVSSSQLAVSIRDYGPGVDEGSLSHLGEIFFRGRDELTRRTRGTGIGLALVRQAASRMNAEARFENAHPGFCVTLSFPRTREREHVNCV